MLKVKFRQVSNRKNTLFLPIRNLMKKTGLMFPTGFYLSFKKVRRKPAKIRSFDLTVLPFLGTIVHGIVGKRILMQALAQPQCASTERAQTEGEENNPKDLHSLVPELFPLSQNALAVTVRVLHKK